MPRFGLASLAGSVMGRERRSFSTGYFDSPDRMRAKGRYKKTGDLKPRVGSVDAMGGLGSLFGGGGGMMGGPGGLPGGGAAATGSGDMAAAPAAVSAPKAAPVRPAGSGRTYAGSYGRTYGGYGGMYGGMYGGYGGMYGGYGGMFGGMYGGMYGGMFGGMYGGMFGFPAGGFYGAMPFVLTGAYFLPYIRYQAMPAASGAKTAAAPKPQNLEAAPPALAAQSKAAPAPGGPAVDGGGGTVNSTGALAGKTASFGGEDLAEAEELLTTNFLREARVSLKKDGIDFSKAKELDAILVELSKSSRQLAGYLTELRKDEPDPANLPEDIEKFVSEVSSKVQEAVRFTTRKKHPSLNATLLKFEAVTFQLKSLSAPKDEAPAIVQGGVSRPGAEGEMLRARDEASDAAKEKGPEATGTEASAEIPAGVSDKELFDPTYMLTGTKQLIGAQFLKQLGLGSIIRKREYEKGETMKMRLANMRRTVGTMRSNKEQVKDFIEIFKKNRPGITTDQAAKMATLTILFGLGMQNLGLTRAKIWALDPKDAGYEEASARAKESYTTGTEMGNVEVVLDDRVAQYEESENIEKIFKEAVSGADGTGKE